MESSRAELIYIVHIEMARTTKEIVKGILKNSEKSRDDNLLLWLDVALRDGHIELWEFQSLYRKLSRFRSFEGVTRARRKIVEENPSLGSSEQVAKRRKEKEEGFEVGCYD